MNAIATYRPGLLGHKVINEVFDNFFNDFPSHLKASTQGYPVADIYHNDDGSTVMEFALAGFTKEELNISVLPDKREITVSANSNASEDRGTRRIARRSFTKTYVNYDNDLDLGSAMANFENGLLTIVVPKQPDAVPTTIDIM